MKTSGLQSAPLNESGAKALGALHQELHFSATFSDTVGHRRPSIVGLYPLQLRYLQLLPKMQQAEADALLLHFRRLLHEHATIQRLFALL